MRLLKNLAVAMAPATPVKPAHHVRRIVCQAHKFVAQVRPIPAIAVSLLIVVLAKPVLAIVV